MSSTPTEAEVIRELEQVCGWRGLPFAPPKRSESMQQLPAVMHMIRAEGRSETGRHAALLELVECVAKNTEMMGRLYSELAVAVLNLDQTDSKRVADRRADFMTAHEMSVAKFVVTEKSALARLASQLLRQTQNPCGGPPQGFPLSDQDRQLHKELAQHHEAIAKIYFKLSGGSTDPAEAAFGLRPGFERHLMNFAKPEESPLDAMRRLLMRIIEKRYEATVAARGLSDVALVKPYLLMQYLGFADRAMGGWIDQATEAVQEEGTYARLLLEPETSKSLPLPIDREGVEELFERSFMFVMSIGMELEETGTWRLLERKQGKQGFAAGKAT